MAAYGLYTHIASNKFRSMLLLAGLFVLVYVMVYAGALIAEVVINSDASVDYYLAAAARDLITAFPYATGAAVLWIVIAYFFHQSIVDAVTGGEDVTRQQQPRLYNLLENLCISRGIPMPKLKVMRKRRAERVRDRAQPAAICRHRHHGPVEGAQRPGDRGGAGPRAHPYPQRRRADDGDRGDHRRRGRLLRRAVLPDVHQLQLEFRRRIVLVVFIVVLLVFVGRRQQGLRRRRAIVVVIIAVALIALAWLLSQLVRLALSRSRELLADAGSVELTKNPDAMISALRKIENRGELPGATSAVMELCVDNPREGFADLFATHPSVDSRVQALVKFAGGHDPGPLALPSDTADGPDDQPQEPANGQVPPPSPSGPWSDAEGPRRSARRVTRPLGQSRRPMGPPLTAPCRGREYRKPGRSPAPGTGSIC